MSQQTAHGSVTIKRLRTGETIYMSFSVTKPLVIFYNESGVITKWDSSSNRPTITPNVTCMTGSSVSIQGHKWSLDGTDIFGSKTGTTVTSDDGKFSMNTTTGALTILSAEIYGATPHNLNLEYSCTAIVNNVGQQVSKPIEISVLSGGSNSYWGSILTQSGQSTSLSSSQTSVTLSAQLVLGGNEVTETYSWKWSKVTASGNDYTSYAAYMGKNLVVTRDDVDGSAHFQCDFYLGANCSGDKVEADGITILDIADELTVIVPDNAEVGYGKTVTITPKLYNTQKKQEVTGVTWSCVVKDSLTYETIASSKYTMNSSTGVFSMSEDNMYNDDGEEINPIILFEATI